VVVANSNIIVSNAVPSTQPASAPPLIKNMPLSPRMDQVLHSRPVTPVKVERLECLLHGYPASLKEYLVSGFSCFSSGGRGVVLCKVLYGGGRLRGPTPYPFVYYFDRKGTPFMYLLKDTVKPSLSPWNKVNEKFYGRTSNITRRDVKQRTSTIYSVPVHVLPNMTDFPTLLYT